jgi:beta-xylosidase
VAMGFVDAASGGNLVAYSTLTTPQSIVNLDVVRIVAGQLSVSLD